MEREVFEKLTKQALVDCLDVAKNIYEGLEDEVTKDTIATFGLNALVPIRLKQLIREQERFAEAKRLYVKLIELQDADEVYGIRLINSEYFEHSPKSSMLIVALCNELGINIKHIEQFHENSSTIEGMNNFIEIVEFMLK